MPFIWQTCKRRSQPRFKKVIVNKSIQAILKFLWTKMLGSQEKDKIIPSLEWIYFFSACARFWKGGFNLSNCKSLKFCVKDVWHRVNFLLLSMNVVIKLCKELYFYKLIIRKLYVWHGLLHKKTLSNTVIICDKWYHSVLLKKKRYFSLCFKHRRSQHGYKD